MDSPMEKKLLGEKLRNSTWKRSVYDYKSMQSWVPKKNDHLIEL